MQTEQQSLRAAAGQRFWQIDALRGLALLNMLVYHAMYDWVYIFGHASGWYVAAVHIQISPPVVS